MGSKSGQSETINLKLILVSGKTAEFQFRPTTTALDVAKHVYENWPEDWQQEAKVDRYEVLRLIYQGRFLHGNVTLGALRLQQGKTTVMHLVPRENLPESANGEHKRRHKHDAHPENPVGVNQENSTSNNNEQNTTTTGCCDTCSIL